MRFRRLRFPQEYDLLPGTPPGALDSFVALSADVRPATATATSTAAQRFPQFSRVQFAGWALAPERRATELPAAVLLGIGALDAFLHARIGYDRDDVARDMRNETFRRAGFRGVQTLDRVTLGRHRLKLVVVSQDGGYYVAPLDREIEIVESSEQCPKLPQSDATKIVSFALEAMHAPIGRATGRFRLGDIVVARGDAWDPATRLPPSQIFAVVDERAYFPGVAGIANERGERFGYSVRIPTLGFALGSHALRVVAVARDDTSTTLGRPMPFTLRRA